MTKRDSGRELCRIEAFNATSLPQNKVGRVTFHDPLRLLKIDVWILVFSRLGIKVRKD